MIKAHNKSNFSNTALAERTFFIWNLMVDLTSSTLVFRFSLWVSREGNLPALFRPGPRIRGICLIRDSEARKASYFLARGTYQTGSTLTVKFPSLPTTPCTSRSLLTELLDQLLVLVELFKSLDVHVWHVSSFSFVTVLLVSQNTHGELGPWESLQPAH